MSQFINQTDDYSSEFTTGIDFDDAVKLPGGGSTCDIFKTRWQRHDVFVKRLKEELRSKPLYLDALDKEYEIGVGLKHPSLPDYREFHRDYIVMDYIDGTTLAEMMLRQEQWLADEKHIRSMLKQLVEVVDYLHRHNVVHCDIKPDNIMITANGYNLVLVDFDKCYTDALNDTSGNPTKYGVAVEDAGSVAIDFHGIAKVVEKLKANVADFKFSKYKEFIKACYRPDITCDELIELLSDTKHSSSRQALLIGSAVIVLGLLIGFISYLSERSEKPDSVPAATISNENNSDTIYNGNESANKNVAEIVIPQDSHLEDNSSQSAIKKQEKETIKGPNAIEVLDENIRPYFNELVIKLDYLYKLGNDTTLTSEQLTDSIRNYERIERNNIGTVLSISGRMFPDFTDAEIGDLVSCTPSYTAYISRAKSVKRMYRAEIDCRTKNE